MNKRWAIVLVLAPGCIRDAGECWVRGEEGDGAGGGVIVGGGVGGFGDVPPEPQAASGAASGDPCVQTAECEVTWSADSDVCKSKGTAGACRTFYQGQHRSLDEAKAACEHAYGVGKNADVQSCGACQWAQRATNDCLEHCKDLCLQMWEKCRDDCPKGNINCLAECTNKLAECNRECDRKCK